MQEDQEKGWYWVYQKVEMDISADYFGVICSVCVWAFVCV